METHIPKAIADFKPNFIVYNAGTDCMKGDPLGNLNVRFNLPKLIELTF